MSVDTVLEQELPLDVPLELVVQILAEDLSKVNFGDHDAGEGRSRFFLGIQKGQEVVIMPLADHKGKDAQAAGRARMAAWLAALAKGESPLSR